MKRNDILTNEIIQNCANKIKNFQIDGKRIGYENACNRINRWAQNFIPFLTNPNILWPLLENIRFVSDEDVLENALAFAEKHIHSLDNPYFYTCLGAETESSSRIIRQINNNPHFAPNLEETLKKIDQKKIRNPIIIFIDDFLNTGGQLCSIIETWFDKTPKYNTNNNYSGYERRSDISHDLLKVLRSCDLRFLFLYGTATGSEHVGQQLKKYELNGKVHILNSFQEDIGIWGTQEDVEHIRNNIDVPISDKSIFYGFSCSDTREIYEILRESGYQLLKANKPDWSVEKQSDRLLGYGNISQLFVSQTNIPTITITALWMGGNITIQNQPLDWQPLLFRKEKKMAGREEYKQNSTGLRPHYGTDLPKNSMEDLHLDIKQGSPTLDMTLLHSIPEPFFTKSFWQNNTPTYMAGLNPLVSDKLGVDSSNNSVFIFHNLNKQLFSKPGSDLSYHILDKFYRFRIKKITLCCLFNQFWYFAVRIQFKKNLSSLKTALELNYHIPINHRQKSGNIGFSVANNTDLLTCGEFFGWAAGLGRLGNTCKSSFQDKQISTLSYIRSDCHLFSNRKPHDELILNLMANFKKPKSDNSKIPCQSIIPLNSDGAIGVSDYGTALLCGNQSNYNRTALAELFHNEFLGLYLLRCVKNKINLELEFTKNQQIILQLEEYKDLLESISATQSCRTKHHNQFLKAILTAAN